VLQAQALIGATLGSVTLQKVLGQGDSGAVFLAQQSPTDPQVAVKVLSPAATQTSSQRAAFLERFRKEIDVISSLEHWNILPVFDFGKHDGLAYLVMPYISGGTLQHTIEQKGPLQLAEVVHYLDQMAAALDYAHGQGVLHLDLKPGNVLLSADGRLFLTDFGLVKMVAERQTSHMRLLMSGTSAGLLDYTAPEQVMGDVVDARADLYSLGVMLYQMVTGQTPFQGTPLQIATQHVHASPPAPRLLRENLPQAAEQVILQAMAKRPLDRHGSARDLASAFRVALTSAGALWKGSPDGIAGAGATLPAPLSVPRRRGLFDPVWQNAAQEEGRTPAASEQSRSKATGLLSASGMAAFRPTASASAGAPEQLSPARFPDQAAHLTRPLPSSTAEQSTAGMVAVPRAPQPFSPFPATGATGALMIPGGEMGASGTVKLTEPVKVIQVPVSGQPGRYVTGFLPVQPRTEPPKEPDGATKGNTPGRDYKKLLKKVALPLLVLLVLTSSGLFWFLHTYPTMRSKTGVLTEQLQPDWQAIAAVQATATASANYILNDPLQQNIHNWPVIQTGKTTYIFKDGAYHVADNDANHSAPALLPGITLNRPLAYSITMQEIKGNDRSINNSFGIIIFLNSQASNGKTVITFYTFEVVNNKGGMYQFLKYDSSKGLSPYYTIWQHPFGREFYQGAANPNTIKVAINGNSFTFWVNGKKVGSAQDNSLQSGQIGMLVNLKGTEVAFSNLQLTYN
jgi:serine/threonine protein kinase